MNKRVKWRRLPGLLCVCMLTSCTTYKANFSDKQVADIGMFTDTTIAMLSDLNLVVSREETVLTRRFIAENEPEEMAVAEMAGRLKLALNNIVRYSIELVNISELEVAETNRVAIYADYLEGFRDSVTDAESVDGQLFESTLATIRGQESFLGALRAAQPLMNKAVIDASLKSGDLISAVEVLSTKLDRRIDVQYKDIIRFRTKLEQEKSDIMTAFELIYDAYRMEGPDLEALRSSGVIWTPEIIPEGRPTRNDLAKIGEHLHSRMTALESAQNAMRENWEDYLAAHAEVDMVSSRAIENVHQARILMLTWVRAHQKMASGTSDPAKWFDIGEVTKSLIKTAPKAVL